MDDFAESLADFRSLGPERYWARKAAMFKWYTPWEKTLDESDPHHPKWFVGGKMNLCYDCLDRHVERGDGGSVAYIFDSPYTKSSMKVTYGELHDKVARLAGALHAKGLRAGDHVLIYMPMIPETVATMLACCRLGLVYYVLMGSYTEFTIAERIDDFQPKLVAVCNGEFGDSGTVFTKQLLDKGLELAGHKPKSCLVLQRSNFVLALMVTGRDFSFNDVINSSEPHECVPVDANQPCFIMYTSGTTGKPKGIVQSVRAVAMQMVQESCTILTLGKSANEVSWMASTFAWIAGQAFVCYMPLYWRKTSILYEASVIRPDALDMYRVLVAYEVAVLFLSIGSLRYILKQDPNGNLASKFKPFRVGGIDSGVVLELCGRKRCLIKLAFGGAQGDLATLKWVQNVLKMYPLQCYGLTEVGGLVTTTDSSGGKSPECQPLLSCGKPIPGLDVKILTETGTEAAIGEEGRIVIKYPSSPALMSTIYKNDALFIDNYLKPFPGYFDLKDNGKFDLDGNLYVLNRNDTIFKAMGNRISCTSLEEVMMAHSDIAECVVVTKILDNQGDLVEIPEGFFLLKAGTSNAVEDIATDVVESVHRQLGKFITFPKPHHVEALPRTITGKIARGTVQDMLRKSSELKNAPQDPTLYSLWKAIKSTET